MNRVNASQLAAACSDPAFLETLKQDPDAKPSKSPPFITPERTEASGSAFHQLVDRFSRWLVEQGTGTTERKGKAKGSGKTTAPATTKADREKLVSTQALWDVFFDRFAKDRLLKVAERSGSEAASNLSLALRAWCERMAVLRETGSGYRSWGEILIVNEHELNGIVIPLPEGELLVDGRIDALRWDGAAFQIVDYKLSKGSKLDSDALQLALYAHLLGASSHGLSVGGQLEYYEPDLHVVHFTAEELDEIFRQKVVPVLREILRAWHGRGDTGDGVTRPHDGTARAIEQCYTAFNITVSVIDWIESPQLVRFRLKPASGVKVTSLANRKADLQVHLGCSACPRVQSGPGAVYVDLPKDEPDTVHWRRLIGSVDSPVPHSPTAFPIGMDIYSRPLIGDLAESQTAHGLIGGVAGSGKSELLKTVVASLLYRNKPESLKLTLVDPKMLTFGAIKESPFLTHPILVNLDEALQVLQDAINQMEQRYATLDSEGFENLRARFEAGKTDIPFWVIIVDEFADLVLADKEQRSRFETIVSRIAAKGRASGLHLLLATQRPDSKVVSPQIKANLPLKICLRVTSGANSQIVLDESGGEDLLGRGDLLCDRGKGIERAQSGFIDKEELLSLRNHCIR